MITKQISEQVVSASVFLRTSFAFLITAVMLLAPLAAFASITLAWDEVPDYRVGVYEVHYGAQSGQYTQVNESPVSTATIDGLNAGQEYFFAVRACCTDTGSCSSFSEELSVTNQESGPTEPSTGQTREYLEPAVGGYRLDLCRIWGTDCGQPAADAFCISQHYDRAESFTIDYGIGHISPTSPIDSPEVCDQSYCDGFSAIVCTTSGSSTVAVNDVATVLEDTHGNTIDVLDNDSAANDRSLTVTDTSAHHGYTTINADNTLSYSPSANFNGTDSITYTISDGVGGTDSATVSVTVTAVNDPPRAENDVASMLEDSAAINLNVLSNDHDVDGDNLTIISATSTFGSVTENSNGTLNYRPSIDFHGTDSVTYTISDGVGGSDSATVSITVTPVNDAPIASDDTAIVEEDSTANTLHVLTNDSDVDSTNLTVSAASASNGSVSVNSNGSLSYSPNANFNGSDTVAYTVRDGGGGSDSATVSITVTPVNDAPIASDDTAIVEEDSTANTLHVLANDSDVDGDPLTVTSAAADNGTVSVNGDSTLIYSPNAGFSGADSVTYVISDSASSTASATVLIQISATDSTEESVPTSDQAAHFDDPMFGGYRVDLCLTWGTDCGQPAADAFCEAEGYAQAQSFTIDYGLGELSPTSPIASTEVCDQAYCDGFASITCGIPEQLAEAPVADFSTDKISGEAPLTILFKDSSTGEVSDYAWDFGDGASDNGAQLTTHTYNEPGVYTVSLSVTGPGGSDLMEKTGLVTVTATVAEPEPEINNRFLEVGEIEVNHEWQRVDFSLPFLDPIVVANVVSHNGSDPTVVRIDAVDLDGFWIRLQEWDYLDKSHAVETVSFVAMERGKHVLPNGAEVEAGSIESDNTSSFDPVELSGSYQDAPVVMTALNTFNESDAATVRTRVIDSQSFKVRIQEQELNAKSHAVETIAYIAWQKGTGSIDGRNYEVGMTSDSVKHVAYPIEFADSFVGAPIFLADMQTLDGGDTANVRYSGLTPSAVQVWVDEEQSKDSEVRHTTEAIGYIAFEYE
jgi:PKD repeat protein